MKKTLSILALGLLAVPGQGWATDNAALEKQIQQLIEQNRILQERVLKLENMVGPGHQPHQEAGLAKQPTGPAVDSLSQRLTQVEHLLEKKKGGESVAQVENSAVSEIMEYVEFSGLVEVEAASSESYDHHETSDLTLATVELGMEVHITEWSHTQLVLLYEEGEESDHLVVDQGTITLGNRDKFPVELTVGKKYLPFGSYLTSMVSDPLALELGEIGDTIAQVGFQAAGLYGSAYVFNGDINERGEDDKIDSYGANIGLAHKFGEFSYDFGMDWLNNVADTDGIGDYLSEVVADEAVVDYVPGFAGHILMAYGPVSFFAEYVGALASFDRTEMTFDNEAARPEAWGVEVGYNTALLGRETLFTLGYQGTAEALALGLPEARYLASVRWNIIDDTSLALEYLHDEDYDNNQGGTGDNANIATMQLAVEF
ncbi:MAG: LbtU family siderophore porin [Proteobacteria bacterium]|nr:LbtU family siderophore porin [Pseudomonadota bacterium]MBU1639180.1 LbtU family siderophore porin [Pseudomonadota bacterium]